MSYQFYKIMHLTGIAMTLLSLGGLMLHAIAGGSKAAMPWRRPVMITHGLGLLLALVGAFGLLARLGIHWPWPGWVIVKLGIWLVLGGAVAVVFRKPEFNRVLWALVIALFAFAAYLANFKPF
jgi:hypothetical protein